MVIVVAPVETPNTRHRKDARKNRFILKRSVGKGGDLRFGLPRPASERSTNLGRSANPSE